VDLARAMQVRVGDRVVLIAPQGNITVAGMVPRLKQFNVTGIFESGHFEYDSALALVNRDDAERLFRNGSVQGLRLKTTDPLEAHEVSRQLLAVLPSNLAARDWGQINRNWFAAVQVEKRMMFIILTLIIAVAAFNLVSSLVMTVTEKQADIAILRTLGASPRSIMAIFMLQGALVGLIGSVLGVAGGTLLALNLDTVYGALGLELIPKGIYFIDYLPTDTRAADVLAIGLTAFVLSILATLYPSWSASRVNPAEALRYE
jgi:lipoprotein-releasing system permease protein